MGGGSYSSDDWKKFSVSRSYDKASTTTDHIFRSSGIDPLLDPKKFKIREAIDSIENPESTPIIIGLDVTGSMSPVLDAVARQGMKTVCEEIYNRNIVTNPQICALGIGDLTCDSAPFQATQFEADIRIFEQLEKLYLEQGGGGNDSESYTSAYYFAKFRTKTDSFPKRGRKGYIFTIGDENIPDVLRGSDIERHFGDMQVKDYSARELFEYVYSEWNVFHLIIKQGNYAYREFDQVSKGWSDIIGSQRVIPIDDYQKIGEVIVSLIEVNAGRAIRDVTNSWDEQTSRIVSTALANVGEGSALQNVDLDSIL